MEEEDNEELTEEETEELNKSFDKPAKSSIRKVMRDI